MRKFSLPKLVAALGLALVLCGFGFAYLGFDQGGKLAEEKGFFDTLQAATGTNQMVCATICISIGVLVWAISIPPPGEHED